MSRVESLISRMTLTEKVGQLTMTACGYAVTGPTIAGDSTEAFNGIVLSRMSVEDFSPQYSLRKCWGDPDEPTDEVCTMVRKGTCTPAPDLDVNAMLRKLGQ